MKKIGLEERIMNESFCAELHFYNDLMRKNEWGDQDDVVDGALSAHNSHSEFPFHLSPAITFLESSIIR